MRYNRKIIDSSWLGVAAALVLHSAGLTGTVASGGPEEQWQTSLRRNHSLTGKIWDVSAVAFVDAQTLAERLTQSRFVLLGEKHDNPDHHRLQAWLLRALIAAGRRPAVGFEMFEIGDGPALAGHLATAPTDAAGLATAVNWSQRGWPDWALYQPIAEAALKAGLPILATNFPRESARAVFHRGLTALDPRLVSRLHLDRPLPPAVSADMANEILLAHCGHASEAMIEAMITVQRARDAQMADSLITANHQDGQDGQDGAVLIAGSLHVRNDRGVPAYLAQWAPEATVTSVAFFEVVEGRTQPGAYAAQLKKNTLPFDYVWFTPRVDETDPCEEFDQQLEHLKEKL